MMYWSGQFVYY